MLTRPISEKDDKAIAQIIRDNLKAYKLDIQGTAYFDECLDHLSSYYLKDASGSFYYILEDDDGRVIGGAGIAEIDYFDQCAELQKLYLADSAKGRGLGCKLMRIIEDKALEIGYKRIYLETHSNLEEALHLYEKMGYREIERPRQVVHATMDRFYIKEICK